MSPVDQIDGKIDAEGKLYFSDQFYKRLEETFSESPIFDDLEKILQEPEPLDWYDIRDYDLSEERKNFRIDDFPDEGDIIFVISYTGKAEIKFDSPNADSFDLETYKRIKHTYTDIYLTNEAQEDATIKILFGRGDWELTETVPEIDIEGTIRNDYFDQITDPLKIGQIIKDSHIVPHADIACEKILISGTKRLDKWRSTEDYTYIAPGMILLHATTKLSDWQHPSDTTFIHGGRIYTESILTAALAALSITTEKLAALSITTEKLDALAVTTVKIAADAVTAAKINVVGLDGATGRIVVGDVTDADEVTVGINTHATTLILPGKIVISGGTNLEDWRAAGDLTLIDGGDIFANSVTATQAQFDDLINVSNLFTLAAGRVVISKNAFGANLEGILINDTVRNRVEIGELTAGVYGITIRDSTGERNMLAGDHRSTTRVSVNLSAQQSNIPNATMTKVLLNAEWFDPGNNFAASRFTAPRDGYYMFAGQIAWTNLPADEAANARLMKGGAAGTRLQSGVGVFNSSPNLYAIAAISTLVWLDEGDYVELFGIHWVGDNTPDIYGWAGRGETFLTVHYVWGGV